MTIDFSFILVIINFVFLLLVLNKILYKPLKAFLSERQTQIKNEVEETTRSVEKANQLVLEKEEELRRAFIEARDIKDTIVKEAEVHAEGIIQNAKQKELDIIQNTDVQLSELNKRRMEEMEHQLADIIVDLTSKVLAERVDGEKDKELINKLLAERGAK